MIQLNRQPRRLPKNKTKQKKRYAGCLAHAVIWRVLPRHCQPTPTQPKYIPDVKYIRAFYSVVSNRRHLNLYYYSIQYAVCTNVFGHLHAFLRPPWVFSRALGCGARRRPACTPRSKFGSRTGSVACALGVQSHGIWYVITRLLSAELEPSTIENPHTSCSAPLLHCC